MTDLPKTEPTSKKPYTRPAMRCLGTVAELTRAPEPIVRANPKAAP